MITFLMFVLIAMSFIPIIGTMIGMGVIVRNHFRYNSRPDETIVAFGICFVMCVVSIIGSIVAISVLQVLVLV